MFFVVSTGRSGTRTIARVLDQHPLCRCAHHHPAHRVLIRLGAEYCHGEIDADDLMFFLEGMFPPRAGWPVVGESDQRFSYVIPLLAALPGSPRFIWLIRDGRDVVASAHARGWYGDEPPRRVWPRARIQGDRSGDLPAEEWAAMPAFERCCWYWAFTNERIAADLAELSAARWTFVRLEDLASAPGPPLTRIRHLLGLPWWPLRIVHANKNPSAPRRHAEWTAEQHAAFERRCGAGMDRWYPDWREDR